MMLVMEMSAYFLAARTVVNREDPVGLLGMGAPEDEYDPEVRDLVKWRKAVTADQVGAVFLRWFGESAMMPSDMAVRIADGITTPMTSICRTRRPRAFEFRRRPRHQRHDGAFDKSRVLGEDLRVTGLVEDAVRGSISPGDHLATPTGRGRFTVARYTTDGLVLLLGQKEAWTPLPWHAMEGIPDFLRGRGWVLVGSLYSTDSQPGSLDAYLKSFLKRATASWVAVVLERAGVIAIDRSRPARVQLRPN